MLISSNDLNTLTFAGGYSKCIPGRYRHDSVDQHYYQTQKKTLNGIILPKR